MRNYLRSLLAGLGSGLFMLAALSTGVYALTVPPTFTPRQFPSQQTHYLRFTVPFNACNYVSLTCTYKAGALPYNSYVTRGNFQVLSTFTGATTMTASIGTAASGTQIVNAQNILTAGAGGTLTIVAANLGEAATGNTAAQTGADGGFDLFVTLTATVAVPTAGLAVLIIEYFAPNDGGCAPVPFGTAPVGC